MKRVLIFLCCSLLFITKTTAQNDGAPAAPVQKFYFPASQLTTDEAFSNAVSKLAGQILTVYTEKEKDKYLINSAAYYSLVHDYTKAIILLDSADKITGDKSKTIHLRSYAIARNKAETDPASFEKAFQNEFTSAFNSLSFNRKVFVSFFDTAAVNRMKTANKEMTDKLIKDKQDSISLKDAEELCENYCFYTIYNSNFTFLQAYTTDPKYNKYYPAIKSSVWSAVYPVQNIEEFPDVKMKYKLLMELVDFGPKKQDSTTSREINGGLAEVGRLINLHVAAGIPKENIEVVVIVHASALFAFLNNDQYKKKYGVDNPNLPILKEMENFGVKLKACGQAILFLGLEKEDLVPGIKVALTAQTVLSTYKLKNYAYYDLSIRE